ncbi:MAG TPA: SMC-Scp complex subunit ScpB [Clostridiales bacterium]|nr:SMC-Scp complex subunit ScpB [Clostridiales bacterium]HBE13947.1 SMC-Scp complex subunit ScpB [Clostridiales bacterium]
MCGMDASAALEAVLFAAGTPLSVERLGHILVAGDEDVRLAANTLKKRLDHEGGIELVMLGDQLQLCTKIAYKDPVTRLLEIRRTAPLSRPALEALAVIAYKQPVTRSYIEQIRGVDCSGIINTLVERGLVEEVGRLDAPGKPILYATTSLFLRSFGLESLQELPSLEEEQLEMHLDESHGEEKTEGTLPVQGEN